MLFDFDTGEVDTLHNVISEALDVQEMLVEHLCEGEHTDVEDLLMDSSMVMEEKSILKRIIDKLREVNS